MSCSEYLRALYLFSVRVPADTAVHLLGKPYYVVMQWYKKFKIATAFAEMYDGRKMVLDEGTLEVDGTTTNVCPNLSA